LWGGGGGEVEVSRIGGARITIRKHTEKKDTLLDEGKCRLK